MDGQLPDGNNRGGFRDPVVAAWHHAVRTPLHGIVTGLGLLGDSREPAVTDVLDAMHEAGRELESTVVMLLECIDAMIGSSSEAPTDAGNALSDVSATVAPLAASRSAQVLVEAGHTGIITQKERRQWHYLLARAIEQLLVDLPSGRRIIVRLFSGARDGRRWLRADVLVERVSMAGPPVQGAAQPEPVIKEMPFRWVLVETALRLMNGRWSRNDTSAGSVLQLTAPLHG